MREREKKTNHMVGVKGNRLKNQWNVDTWHFVGPG